MMLRRRILLTTAVVALLGQVVLAREWADATGKFKTEAELVKVEAGVVFLKKQSDGATIQVPLARLSAADQAYLQSLESPAPELAAGSEGLNFPLATANCVGLIVLNPKPVFEQEALSQGPLKDLIEQGVMEAGIDFRKITRVTVLLLEPDLEAATAGNQNNAVAVAEFSEAVDPTSMLSKIPTDFEQTTVAGKACHKSTEEPNALVCVIDEKTLAFAADEESLAAALTATSDDADLAKLLAASDKKSEIICVFNLAPMRELFTTLGGAPPEAAEILDTVKKVDSFTFTTDLDGAPSVELLIQAGDESSAGDLEQAIKDGLAQLPELVKAGAEAAKNQEAPPGMPMNPAKAAEMLGGAMEKMDEVLLFEQQGASLKISVKFPPETPPLIQTITQAAGFFAMMNQQSGSEAPFGAPPVTE
jgi:SLA1 Homology Domain 1 (SHD1) protein